MPLILTEEQTMLRDNARGFLGKNAPIAHLRALRDGHDRDGFSRELWKEFAKLGWSGILVPQEYDGTGLGHVEAGVIMEELGHTLTPSPYLATAVVAATAIVHGGNEQQKKVLLPRIAKGELIATLAVDESAKHRPEKIALSAERKGNEIVLNGAKTFVIDGHVADLIIVAAQTQNGAEKRLVLLLVESDRPGLHVERIATVDIHNAARVTFENVKVKADAMLADVDTGGQVLEGALNVGRAGVAAELVGLSDEVFNRTVTYLRERKQFGKLIGEFQALQHRAAELYVDIEISRAATLKALQTLDGDFDHAGAAVAVAKAKAGTTATRAVQEGVQMHGGMGMTDQFDIGFFMKRARVCEELFGDANFHADQLARSRSY